MKILYVANSRFPSERAHMVQIVHMCNALVSTDNEVILLVTNRQTHIDEDPVNFYGQSIKFKIERVSIPDIVGHIKLVPKPLRPIAFMLQRILFALKVKIFLQSHAFDYLYGRDEWVLWLLSKIQKTPVIWESHEAKFSFPVRKLFNNDTKVVVISEGIRDFYRQQGIAGDKMLVAHDGIDETFFATPIDKNAAREKLNLSLENKIAMYIGGFEAWKGIDTFCQAAKLTREIDFVVIGGKPEEVERYKQKYPKVNFLGPKPYKDLRDNQQAADVLVIPNSSKSSLGAKYTSPLKLFAHMTANRPIVASKVPSIENVLNDNECAFFTPDSPESLASTVSNILNNPDEATKIAQAALAKSTSYTWKNRAENICEFIKFYIEL